MGRIPIDVTVAGATPEGDYLGTVTKMQYQVKVGEKWNQDGTKSCDTVEEWLDFPVDMRRLHATIKLEKDGKGFGNEWNDLYMKESALGFTKTFLQACGVAFDKTGFDADDCLNKQVAVHVAVSEDPVHGMQTNLSFRKI